MTETLLSETQTKCYGQCFSCRSSSPPNVMYSMMDMHIHYNDNTI